MGQQAKWENVDLQLVKSLLRNVVFGSQPGSLGERLEQSRRVFQLARGDCEKYLRTSILPQTVGRGLAFESGPGAKVEFRVNPEGFVQISITPPDVGEITPEPIVVPEPIVEEPEEVEEPEVEEPVVEEPVVEEPVVEAGEPEVEEPEVEEPEVEEPETKPKRNQTVPFIAELRERADALGVDISSFGQRRKEIFKHLEEVAASDTKASDEDIVVIGEESPVEIVDEEEEGPTVDVIVLDDVYVTPKVMEGSQTQRQEAVVDILEIEDLLVDEGGEDPPERLSLQDKMLQASKKVDLDAECPMEDAYKDDGEEDEEDVVVYEPPPTDDGDNENDDGDDMYHESASAFEPINFDDILDDDDDE